MSTASKVIEKIARSSLGRAIFPEGDDVEITTRRLMRKVHNDGVPFKGLMTRIVHDAV